MDKDSEFEKLSITAILFEFRFKLIGKIIQKKQIELWTDKPWSEKRAVKTQISFQDQLQQASVTFKLSHMIRHAGYTTGTMMLSRLPTPVAEVQFLVVSGRREAKNVDFSGELRVLPLLQPQPELQTLLYESHPK